MSGNEVVFGREFIEEFSYVLLKHRLLIEEESNS
jgi:hypothetical protein